MQAMTTGDGAETENAAPVRLRLDIYDALATSKGYHTREAQAAWHGLNRATWVDLRMGRTTPGLDTAMGISKDCGVAVEVLWEWAA